eukprot:2484431-Rhodomonas_salina.1
MDPQYAVVGPRVQLHRINFSITRSQTRGYSSIRHQQRKPTVGGSYCGSLVRMGMLSWVGRGCGGRWGLNSSLYGLPDAACDTGLQPTGRRCQTVEEAAASGVFEADVSLGFPTAQDSCPSSPAIPPRHRPSVCESGNPRLCTAQSGWDTAGTFLSEKVRSHSVFASCREHSGCVPSAPGWLGSMPCAQVRPSQPRCEVQRPQAGSEQRAESSARRKSRILRRPRVRRDTNPRHSPARLRSSAARPKSRTR